MAKAIYMTPEVGEEWRDVPGFEGWYMVSNLGRMATRHRNHRPFIPGELRLFGGGVAQECNKYGYVKDYWRVDMWESPGVHAGSQPVHRLILEAFIGPRPPGCDGSHLNDKKWDNRIENLCWESRSANMRRAFAKRPARGATK